MKKILLTATLLSCLILSVCLQALAEDRLPPAEGFGSDTRGGMTGTQPRLFVVSTLKDAGPGSLRSAVESSGPRIVAFSVAGVIHLSDQLKIKDPYLTVAGETAPSPGIAIVGERTAVMTHDVILRHLRFFVGDSPGKAKGSDRQSIAIMGVKGNTAQNVLIDHCFIGGAVDENISTNGDVHDITLRDSIIADSLDKPVSSAAHEKGHHGKGVHIGDGTRRFSLIRNLIADNQDRNPRFKQGAEGEMINCVVYGWGGDTGWNVLNASDSEPEGKSPVYANIIGNTYVAGPEGRCDISLVFPKDLIPGTKLFLRDNTGPSCDGGGKRRKGESPIDSKFLVDSHPLPLSPGLKILPAREAYELVLAHSGPRRADAFEDDTRVVREVSTRTGKIKSGIWGYEKPDVFFPSIPEKTQTLALPKDPWKMLSDGKTGIERWMEDCRKKVELSPPSREASIAPLSPRL